MSMVTTLSLTFAFTVCSFSISEANANNSKANKQDSLALLELYNALNGVKWNNPWNINAPVSKWKGITQNSEGRVIAIKLANQNLNGTLGRWLYELEHLITLNLSHNIIQGSIPNGLRMLYNLETLDLRNNDFSGNIPTDIGDLAYLQHLNLSNNNLTGPLPKNIRKLSHLIYLNLSLNKLKGNIPIELGELYQLEYLNLSENRLRLLHTAAIASLVSLKVRKL